MFIIVLQDKQTANVVNCQYNLTWVNEVISLVLQNKQTSTGVNCQDNLTYEKRKCDISEKKCSPCITRQTNFHYCGLPR